MFFATERTLTRRLWRLALLLFFGSAAAAETEYSVGVVPQFDARTIHETWEPILKQVGQATGLTLTLRVPPGIPAFERAFTAGEYDLVYLNPYHQLVAHRTQGYIPLVREHDRDLSGILVVARESPIQRVEELDGKRVAFPAPNALGASLIPRAEFARTFHITVQPAYVRSHGSVYLNVLTGQADAGGGIQATFDQQKPEVRDGLRIIHRTLAVAPHPVAIHPRVPAADREFIRQGLLDLGATPEGAALLRKVPIERIGPATQEDYTPLEALDLESFYVREPETDP